MLKGKGSVKWVDGHGSWIVADGKSRTYKVPGSRFPRHFTFHPGKFWVPLRSYSLLCIFKIEREKRTGEFPDLA